MSEHSATARQFDLRRILETIGPLVTLLLLFVATALTEHYHKGSDAFLKIENLVNILRQWSFVGIISLGMTLVIISGGIDLSVGSLVAFAGGMGIWTMQTVMQAQSILQRMDSARDAAMELPYSNLRSGLAHLFVSSHMAGSERWGLAVGIATMFLIGTLGGLFNGLLIAKGRLAPFIATLGGLAAYRSFAMAVVDGGTYDSRGIKLFAKIGGGMPIPGMKIQSGLPLLLPYSVIVFFALAIIAAVVLNRTRYGRYVYAIGSNERAARYSAINVGWIKIITYFLSGLTCAIAALMLSTRYGAVTSSSTASLFELDAIAAVVIGGTRMQGGSGSIFGTVVGVLILGVISNMLIILDVSTYLQGAVKGGVIIVAALVQQIGQKEN